MRQIIVESPIKVSEGKIVIPIVFPAWRTNLTVEEAKDLNFQLTKQLIAMEYRKPEELA